MVDHNLKMVEGASRIMSERKADFLVSQALRGISSLLHKMELHAESQLRANLKSPSITYQTGGVYLT